MKRIIGILMMLNLGVWSNTNCNANSCNMSGNMSGFYFGPQLGISTGPVKLKYQRSNVHNFKDDHNNHGIVAGLFAGYQKVSGMFVLGAEMYFDISKTEGTFNDKLNPLEIKFKKSWDVGAAAKIGAKMNRLVVYGKLVIDNSSFHTKISDNGQVKKAKKYLLGFGPALGIEGMVSPNMMLGLEGTLLTYSNKNFITQIGGQPATAKFKPTLLTLKLRLAIKLG